MKDLAELILSLCGLLEAEGRLLKENALDLTFRCSIMVIGLLFGAAALACMVAAAYSALLLMISRPAAIALMGLMCAMASAGLLWSLRGKCRKQNKAREIAAETPPQSQVAPATRQEEQKEKN